MPILWSYHPILGPTFNVANLTLYCGPDNEEDSEEQAITLPTAPPLENQIIDVLDDQIVSTRQGGFQKLLVHWRNRPIFDATSITTTDFQNLKQDLYERYQTISSPKSSSSKLGRVNAVWKPKKAPGPT